MAGTSTMTSRAFGYKCSYHWVMNTLNLQVAPCSDCCTHRKHRAVWAPVPHSRPNVQKYKPLIRILKLNKGYIGIMEKKMETTGIIGGIQDFCRDYRVYMVCAK